MKHFETKPAPGNFGKHILGLNLAKPLEPEVFKDLFEILYKNRFIVIKDQELTPAQYLRFGKCFGTPIPHVLDHMRLEGYPEIFPVTNKPKSKEAIKKKLHNGAAHWHTDQSYEDNPATATMLYSLEAPKKGGETRIANMAGAYDALSDEMKSRISELEVEHLYGKGIAHQKDDLVPEPLINKDQINAVPSVFHKLVRPHPVTRQKMLYSPGGTSRGIKGMAFEEAKVLLNELAAHALQPQFQNKHKHAVGDVLIWDTSATMHAATPIDTATGPDDTRYLHRISVRGIPSLLQELNLVA